MSNTQLKLMEGNRWMAAVLLLGVSHAWAQGDEHAGHAPPNVVPAPTVPVSADTLSGMDHSTMPGMDHGAMSEPPKDAGVMPGMDHSGHTAMQNDAAPTELRDPHAYSGGYDYSQFSMRHEDHNPNYSVLVVDRLEGVRSSDRGFMIFDIQASYGGDDERAVLKSEGEVNGGDLNEASTELLWGHAASPFWNSQLGLRYDSGEGPARSWLAFGVQGLAPYWFEVDATAYIGQAGRTALNIEAEYELLLTQKLILQPRIEATLLGKRDAARGVDAGLSNIAAGIRLRYEIRREFAPYVGIEWSGAFGGTADYIRDSGSDPQETRAVAGIRFWF